MSNLQQKHQVLVIGAGLAGAATALDLADSGIQVCLATDEFEGGNSALAQGGIIYPESDYKQLYADILEAGHNYNSNLAVDMLCKKGRQAVDELLIDRLAVPFNKNKEDGYDLALEGGHSNARILHCADYTGLAIMQKLREAVLASKNIQILKTHTLVNLITTDHNIKSGEYRYQLINNCLGAYLFNETSNSVETHFADYTVLATGGVGQLYLHSTNSPQAIGSGIAAAYRTGAVRLCNLEFIQFHPTTFFKRNSPNFLLTEALRGEGAKLVNVSGEEFMHKYDPRKDLAPRDIVSKSIVEEMLKTNHDCVYLSTKHIDGDITARFPTVYKNCLQAGIDITKENIPVVPAAHYSCGGILVDDIAKTTLNRLYALGEVSCTGLHGANRLASTSLLECIVWARSCANDIAANFSKGKQIPSKVFNLVQDWQNSGNEHNDDPVLIAQDWSNIRNTMWNYVGIVRTEARLKRAFEDLRDITRQLFDFYHNTPISKELINLFHGSQTAYAITQAALNNKASLGCHTREDKNN